MSDESPDVPATNPCAPDQPSVEESQAPEPLATFFALPQGAKEGEVQDAIDKIIAKDIADCQLPKEYNLLFLCDLLQIGRMDADRIYRALEKADRKRPILLMLHSGGGDVPSAYFIGKLCREYSQAGFEVVVPREAKSAATLVCCAADRIHMGSLSELGPIDPQIRRRPALAVKHSVEHLADLVTRFPGAGPMLSDYLAKSLPIELLGHYERAAKSACSMRNDS